MMVELEVPMKVRVVCELTDVALRTVRASYKRGGKATRRESVLFINRAVAEALKAAPEPKPARRPRPKPEPPAPPVEVPEGSKEAETIARLRRLYKLTGGAAGRPVVGEGA
jgi:hypothetical protein